MDEDLEHRTPPPEHKASVEGLLEDYDNEYLAFGLALKDASEEVSRAKQKGGDINRLKEEYFWRQMKSMADTNQGRIVRKIREVNPPDRYPNVVKIDPDKLRRLDAMADGINMLYAEGKLTIEELMIFCEEAEQIIQEK